MKIAGGSRAGGMASVKMKREYLAFSEFVFNIFRSRHFRFLARVWRELWSIFTRGWIGLLVHKPNGWRPRRREFNLPSIKAANFVSPLETFGKFDAKVAKQNLKDEARSTCRGCRGKRQMTQRSHEVYLNSS
jgi:hypothetical protein